MVKNTFSDYTTEGYYSGLPDLLALYLSGTPSLTTGTRPPSCLHLDNRLYMPQAEFEPVTLASVST